MDKHKTIINLVALSFMMIFLIGIVSAVPTITRTIPTSISPNTQFQATYTVGNAPTYFLDVVEENLTGGCTSISGATNLGILIDSQDGLSKTITLISGSSGTCTFQGKFIYNDGGTAYTTSMPDATLSINTACTSGATQNCNSNNCNGTMTCTNGVWGTCNIIQSTCIINECTSGQTANCTASNSCGGIKLCTSENKWGTCTSSLTKCNDGTCQATCTNNGGTTPTVTTFDLNQVLFKINTFEVTWLIIILAIVAVIFIAIVFKK